MAESRSRLRFLDGHRGVAILLVILFHAYARWPALMPSGRIYAQVPLFHLGWLGVELFFLISGFVILMTLERCGSIGDFLRRRWTRLMPAMAVASALLLLTAPLLPERPFPAPHLQDLLPGLLFVEPYWLSKLLGVPVAPLEPAFWSLFVEVKFYVFAAVMVALGGRRALLAGLAVCFAIALAVIPLRHASGLAFWPWFMSHQLSFEYFGWFAAGCLFYIHSQDPRPRTLILAVLMAGVSAIGIAVDQPNFTEVLLGAVLMAGFFALSMVWGPLQRGLQHGALQWLALISYPLYLMHEGAMIALSVRLARIWPWLPHWSLPWLALLPVVLLAWFTAVVLERPARQGLEWLLKRRWDFAWAPAAERLTTPLPSGRPLGSRSAF